MTQAWAETGRRLMKHIRKSVLVVSGDFLSFYDRYTNRDVA